MLATLLIYGCALALFAVAGLAVRWLLGPREGAAGTEILPLGAAALILAVYPLGYVLEGGTVIVVVLAVVALAFLGGLLLRRRRGGWPRPRAYDLVVVGFGALVGALLLIPLFRLGFPTTVGIGIADGWARSILIEWVLDHPLEDAREAVGSDRPAGSYSALSPAIAAGFEYLGGMVVTLTGRRGFEVALPLASTAAPLAACGWVRLWEVVAARRPRAWQVALMAGAAASPVFVLPFADNYLTQMFSLALWPFAVASALAFFAAPSARTLVVAAIALGGIAGTYPPVLPWVVPAVLVLALYTRKPRGGAPVDRARAILVALVALGLAVLVLAPIAVLRAEGALTQVSGLRSNAGFPLFEAEHDLALVLGGLTQFSLPPFGAAPSTGALLVMLVVLLGAVGVAALGRGWPRWTRSPVVALALTVSAVTVAVYLKQKFDEDYGYGAYKALLFGGALLAGLLLVALTGPGRSLRVVRTVAAVAVLAVWIPATADLLDRQKDGGYGFKAADRELGQAMEALPESAVVLVEGAAENATSFNARMTATYFGVAYDIPVDGIGTTYSYISGGGAEEWRPDRPWTHVVAHGERSPFERGRQVVRQAGPYRLEAAPPLDVTPYAVARPDSAALSPAERRWWLPPAPGGEEPVDYIGGAVELVVANRHRRAREVRVTLALVATQGARRTVVLKAAGQPRRRVSIGPARPRDLHYDVRVPAGGTRVVRLDPGEPIVAPGQPPQALLALTEAEVRVATVAPLDG